MTAESPDKTVDSARCRALSLRAKVLLAMGIVAASVAVASLVTNYQLRRKQLLGEFQVFVRSVAGTTALALRGDDLELIRSEQDAHSAAFQRARNILDGSRTVNHLAEHEIYILRPVAEAEPWTMEFVAMLQPKTFIGSRYTIPEDNRAALHEAWTNGMPTATRIYRDENGSWISGYAPVVNGAGKPVALVEADAEIDRFLARQRNDLLLGLGVAVGAFCVAMVPGLLLANNITRGVQRLAYCVKRFKSGDHQVEARLRTGDEIEELGGVFNEMVASLREKLALLPYVSRFTAEAVRRSREDPSLLSGTQRDVIVLFADLRGFTNFSESRDACQLVRELNSLLAIEADVVVGAGGDVDKFIGDAVMAVFIDSRDSADAVFACALRLMERVREETSQHDWSLALGVGIHCGKAVVGSIGSESRRDFTAVGHTVNLASRLCDRAAPWEILASDTFHQMLSTGIRQRFKRTAPMEFKNVKQAVTTYACRLPVADVAAGQTG
jgi:class 3 adenylate cyclase